MINERVIPRGGEDMKVVQEFTPQQKQWIQLVVRDASRKEIAEKVFHFDLDSDPVKAHRMDCKLYRWRRHPDYRKEWDAAYKEVWGDALTEDTKVAIEGLRDKDNPWRRTQHANMVLTYATRLINGDESNTFHVKVEGLPEIGTPDEDG